MAIPQAQTEVDRAFQKYCSLPTPQISILSNMPHHVLLDPTASATATIRHPVVTIFPKGATFPRWVARTSTLLGWLLWSEMGNESLLAVTTRLQKVHNFLWVQWELHGLLKKRNLQDRSSVMIPTRGGLAQLLKSSGGLARVQPHRLSHTPLEKSPSPFAGSEPGTLEVEALNSVFVGLSLEFWSTSGGPNSKGLADFGKTSLAQWTGTWPKLDQHSYWTQKDTPQ